MSVSVRARLTPPAADRPPAPVVAGLGSRVRSTRRARRSRSCSLLRPPWPWSSSRRPWSGSRPGPESRTVTTPAPRHVPVLLERCVALLAPAMTDPGSVLVDATLGMGGHSEAMLRQFPELRLVGLDRDPQALDLSRERLAPYADRTTLVHAVYDQLPSVLAELGLARVQGVLFDLGVSSCSSTSRARASPTPRTPAGHADGPDPGLTAADVVNTYSGRRAGPGPAEYGEERFASRIAARLVRDREREPVHHQLAARRPRPRRHPRRDPADRRQPGQAHLPGAADRGQRRAGRAGARPARRRRRAGCRRPDRRDVVPVARGPVGQAGLLAAGAPAPRRRTCRSSPRRSSRGCDC